MHGWFLFDKLSYNLLLFPPILSNLIEYCLNIVAVGLCIHNISFIKWWCKIEEIRAKLANICDLDFGEIVENRAEF